MELHLSGITKERVYELVQKNAMRSWTEKVSFRKLILGDARIGELCTDEELKEAFSEKALLSGIGDIFSRFESEI